MGWYFYDKFHGGIVAVNYPYDDNHSIYFELSTTLNHELFIYFSKHYANIYAGSSWKSYIQYISLDNLCFTFVWKVLGHTLHW